MKHVTRISKTPALAIDSAPPTVIIAFVQAILDALLAFFTAKEAENTP